MTLPAKFTAFASPRARLFVFGLILFVSIFAVYQNIGGNQPIPFDDRLYVTGNHQVQQGLNWATICWAFTNVDAANWHPLTWLSHLLDWQLFGKWIGPVMIQNLFWHSLNSFLILILFRRVLSDDFLAFALALIFALHPQNVESVAWLSQRKTQISHLFLMLVILVYLEVIRIKPGVCRVGTILVCYVLSLLAKPSAVSLAPILAFWLLNENLKEVSWSSGGCRTKVNGFWNVCLKTISNPVVYLMFVVSVSFAVLTFLAQKNAGAVASNQLIDTLARALNAGSSLHSYFTKFIAPSNLTFFYPWTFAFDLGKVTFGYFFVVVWFALGVLFWRASSLVLIGAVWFLVGHLPTIGLVQVGSQSYADRYMYLPMVGLLLSIGALVKILLTGVFLPKSRFWFSLTGVAFAVGLGLQSFNYLLFWDTPQRAYRRSLDLAGFSYTMALNLASEYSNRGFLKSALPLNERALASNPDGPLAVSNLGTVYAQLGRYEEALPLLKRATELEPDSPKNQFQLGFAQILMGKEDEGKASLRKARNLLPEDSWDSGIAAIRANLNNINAFVAQQELAKSAELGPVSLENDGAAEK